jgi:hypothetical protein
MVRSLFSLLAILLVALPADAQDFSVTSSRQSVEKGEDVRVDLEIRTDQEPLHHLQVEVVLPLGFTLKAPPPPIPDLIEAGGSLVLPLTVQAPAQLHEISDPSSRGISTRDPKIFYSIFPTLVAQMVPSTTVRPSLPSDIRPPFIGRRVQVIPASKR